jgi:FKBP-type peptidyl-prolyl cis-trans isomerase (trigger factor)
LFIYSLIYSFLGRAEERTVKEMQEQISDANVQRHLLSLSVRNLDRKINIIIKSRKMQLEGRVEDEEVEQEVCDSPPPRSNIYLYCFYL